MDASNHSFVACGDRIIRCDPSFVFRPLFHVVPRCFAFPTEVLSRRFTGSGGVPLTIQKGSAAIGALARALPITSVTAELDLVVAGATACGAIFAAFHARHAMCLHVEPIFQAPGQE